MRRGAAFLLLLGAVQAVRIEVGRFGVSPREPQLEYFNAYSNGLPNPIMEDPEPENRILSQPGARVPGLQIENVVSALSYRYPNPPTTPRPNSIQAIYPLPADLPNAYAAPRPAPLPALPPRQPPVLVSNDGYDPLLADPAIFQVQLAQQQVIQQQAQVIQQQRQNQAAQAQIQLATQRQQMRDIMRQRIRQRIAQQQQEDALRQQLAPLTQIPQPELLQTQAFYGQQPLYNQQQVLVQQQPRGVPITQTYFQLEGLHKK